MLNTTPSASKSAHSSNRTGRRPTFSSHSHTDQDRNRNHAFDLRKLPFLSFPFRARFALDDPHLALGLHKVHQLRQHYHCSRVLPQFFLPVSCHAVLCAVTLSAFCNSTLSAGPRSVVIIKVLPFCSGLLSPEFAYVKEAHSNCTPSRIHCNSHLQTSVLGSRLHTLI